ncbi:toll/interleukin-1 receptor domain-containing protein [Chromobacterium piscinae]|uniref:toll/interleukin-1 receptor domain-containing protein n=1 Tax=Chromobacterium piscinae TaxID=686831 RepID=UPI001E3E752E|nr:toll/interleukin-1 receptor domain-containing protein [Chromobacterium piscinae]MCD5326783.1 toll/interleukin-1 receptor domain-containing protein [Chromobacterium piscinae]
MGLFKDSTLRARAARGTTLQKSATKVLDEKAHASAKVAKFDIFLSHSLSDQELILGIWLSLEDMGYKVYVDWIHDRQLSRDSVSKDTAHVLRQRMLSCKSLFFATTTNSTESKWMPWELGFKDGQNHKAAILPVARTDTNQYAGQEYLGIYPYVSKDPTKGSSIEKLWINASPTCYVLFDDWLLGKDPYERGK